MSQQIQHVALSFVFAFVFWALLVGSLSQQELVAGLLVAASVAAMTAERQPILAGFRLAPMAPVSFLVYLVLTPSLPIRPAMVQVSTSLRSDLGRLVLANSITLTPGTLTVDVDDDVLTVHWIDCPPGTDIAAATAAIADGFERHLRGFLK